MTPSPERVAEEDGVLRAEDGTKTTGVMAAEKAANHTPPMIVVTHVYPPIPVRHFDWCAHYDGQEEVGPVGWGATEGAAIADLKEQTDD